MATAPTDRFSASALPGGQRLRLSSPLLSVAATPRSAPGRPAPALLLGGVLVVGSSLLWLLQPTPATLTPGFHDVEECFGQIETICFEPTSAATSGRLTVESIGLR